MKKIIVKKTKNGFELRAVVEILPNGRNRLVAGKMVSRSRAA